MEKQLLVATRNQGKVNEFSQMLANLDLNWLSLVDAGVGVEVEETGLTFRENAILKAQTYARLSGLMTLADDSGLVVDALAGAPGVHTARYGGVGLTSEERYQFLLENMQHVPWDERTARFQCVIVMADPDGKIVAESEGVCEGMIALEPAGSGGFGYDPVFYLPAYNKTMAQMGSVKHQISHRGRALRAIMPRLREILAG